jgi:hypothetical protein
MNERARRVRDSLWGRVGIVGTAGYHADRVLDQAQVQVFRLLWIFLPEPSVAQDIRFQHLLLSRVLSEAGQQTLTFGAIVALAREGGTALEVALIGVAALIPPAFVGLYGGVVADALPKRLALAGAYTGQALLCFSIPLFFDTSDVAVMFCLILATSTLAQVSAPTESSVLPLVATEEQLASAASLINLAAAAGQGFAAALFAPILVKAFGVEAAIYMAGVLLLLAASRVFDLPVGDRDWRMRFPPMRVRLRSAVRWLITHPAVGTMIVLSVLAGTVTVVLITLAPRYVEAVLDTDATNTAYVFAPTAVGVALGLMSAPLFVKWMGERTAAIIALFVAALALFLLGIVDAVASFMDPVNPLNAYGLVGLHTNDQVRAAGLLAVPLAFGVALTTTCVQTYINRRVPIAYQGRTFALQGALRNGAAIPPLLMLGALAAEFGADTVLLFSPLLLLAVAYGLVYVSFRLSGLRAPRQLTVLESFWEEPET